MGVVFADNSGNETFVTRRLTLNDPQKILARVPALPAGTYTLRIVTRYSKGLTLLNEARIIEYNKKLVIL